MAAITGEGGQLAFIYSYIVASEHRNGRCVLEIAKGEVRWGVGPDAGW
jgi:hypothetical protein